MACADSCSLSVRTRGMAFHRATVSADMVGLSCGVCGEAESDVDTAWTNSAEAPSVGAMRVAREEFAQTRSRVCPR